MGCKSKKNKHLLHLNQCFGSIFVESGPNQNSESGSRRPLIPDPDPGRTSSMAFNILTIELFFCLFYFQKSEKTLSKSNFSKVWLRWMLIRIIKATESGSALRKTAGSGSPKNNRIHSPVWDITLFLRHWIQIPIPNQDPEDLWIRNTAKLITNTKMKNRDGLFLNFCHSPALIPFF